MARVYLCVRVMSDGPSLGVFMEPSLDTLVEFSCGVDMKLAVTRPNTSILASIDHDVTDFIRDAHFYLTRHE